MKTSCSSRIPVSPLSPWERVRVRAWACAVQGLVNATAIAFTPALSQGEREPIPAKRRSAALIAGVLTLSPLAASSPASAQELALATP